MHQVHEINSIEQLGSLRSDWDRLLGTTERASFFHTLAWLQVYWRHFGAGQVMRVLVVTRAGEVEGILPLVVRRETRRVGRVRVLSWPLDAWGSFYGPLGNRPAEVLAAGLRHVKRTARNWDLIDLRWMDAHGPLASATRAAMSAAGLPSYTRIHEQTGIIQMGGSWDEYLASRRSKWRNNLRRWQRRLREQGQVSYQRYRPCGEERADADPRWDLFDECLQVARRSWQGSSRDGTTLSHPEVCEFLRDTHAVAAREGCLDVNLLRLDGRAVAFAYNYCFRGNVYGLRIGFDASLSRDGVGNLLYCEALKDSFGRGDHSYDLGPGSLQCKRHLWTEVVELAQFTHFRPTGLRAQALRWKGQLTGGLSPADPPLPELVTR